MNETLNTHTVYLPNTFELVDATGGANVNISTTYPISIIQNATNNQVLVLADPTTNKIKKIINENSYTVFIQTNNGTTKLENNKNTIDLSYKTDRWYIGSYYNNMYKWFPNRQPASKLIGTGYTGTPQQGDAVAISASGDTAIVGGSTNNTNIGAVWIFIKEDNSYVQQGLKLIGSDYSGTARQGISVAISADGNTIAFGGANDNTNVGAVWVFTRTAGVWSQVGNKLVGTGATGSARQGVSITMSGDSNTIAFGGTGDNTNVGAVWVFVKSNSVWSQQGSKLVGDDVSGAASFGSSVSLSYDGNTMIVGGYGDDTNVGAIWIYTRTGTTWTQLNTKLTASDDTGTAKQGISVAMSADGLVAIVGGNNDNSGIGGAWLYKKTGLTWTQYSNKILPSNATGSSAFGQSVAISADGTTFAVGGHKNNSDIGAIWIFITNGGNIQQSSKIICSDLTGTAYLGYSASMSCDGRKLIVGGSTDNSSIGASWILN